MFFFNTDNVFRKLCSFHYTLKTISALSILKKGIKQVQR